MKKQQYIQPEISTMVLPEKTVMGFNPSPGEEYNPAPSRGMGAIEGE